MDLYFSHFLYQLIAEPTRTTERTKTLIDHILSNSPEKVIQRGVIEMGLPEFELLYCSRKMSFLKLNKYNELSVKTMKNYSDEIFVEQLRSITFRDFSNYKCVSDAD